tara:strand:- start:874 stop:1467 length:594 start_codon:yes stop_codon:yes gene_type:complete
MYDLLDEKEQRRILNGVMQECAYILDVDMFYEKNKLAHFARKTELQNKFLQYASMSEDRGMIKTVVNFFQINLFIVEEKRSADLSAKYEIRFIPVSNNFLFKGAVIIMKIQNKYYPFTSNEKFHNFVNLNEFEELNQAVQSHKTRQKYKLKPYYTYKVDGLIETAKQFHITTTKPGRFNKLVNKTKNELYVELKNVL